MFRSLMFALGLTAALPGIAAAQEDLGVIGADIRLGYSSHEIEGGFASGTVDVAITPFHGAQFDLHYEERANGGIGRLGTVLYMTPRAGQKYGLSAMVADRNNQSSTYGQIGAAGLFAIAPGWSLEARAGIGLSADNDLDWVTAGGGLHWQARPGTRFYGRYDIASFDEQTFLARGHDVTFGTETQLGRGPSAVFAEVSRDWLSGTDRAEAETTLRLGVSLSLGRRGGGLPHFTHVDPMRQLLRRGLY